MSRSRPNVFRFLLMLALLTGVVAGAGTAFAADAPPPAWTREKLQKLYVDYLSREGFRPELDTEGDVRFRREGKTYILFVQEDDPSSFILALPDIWLIRSDAELAPVLVAADNTNAHVKTLKVNVVKDRVWMTVELFLPRPEDFAAVFPRSLAAIDDGVKTFAARMSAP